MATDFKYSLPDFGIFVRNIRGQRRVESVVEGVAIAV